MRRTLPLLLSVGLAAGCRTAGPQVALRDCRDCTVTLSGRVEAAQGKQLSGEISPEVSAAASVAAQASDNVLSQNGDASKSGAEGTHTVGSDATSAPVVGTTAAATEDE
jgi:hypothetical protein